ncbi:membrane protein insertase YidC [uncultured Algimonas sp.]|uniref:membrane protein insertase YidC n=1 Tax=uncultured Algimonas sp. TaxID=1547920 RepID=UPI00261C3D0C|nr:membrane protein insertase YidC [uncultured Algimonas sp.]
MDDQRRFITAMALSAVVFMAYWFLFVLPTQQAAKADAEREMERLANERPVAETVAPAPQPREVLVATGQRIRIDAPGIRGSLLTTGARLDDVTLNDYDKTLDPADGQVELLSPEGSVRSGLVADNWVMPGMTGDTLGLNTPWAVVSGTTLSPDSPVVLRTTVGGVDITRTLTVDDHFLITADDVLTNNGAQPVTLNRRGVARQVNLPEGLLNFFIIQEGPVSVQDDSYHDFTYKKAAKEDWSNSGAAGWAGITDRYWLHAAIAPQDGTTTVDYTHRQIDGNAVWDSAYTTEAMTLTPGATLNSTAYLYAGAKERPVLEAYEDELGIVGMSRAIDWGMMGLLVRPIMWLLSWLGNALGNFGLGILALTFIIKLLMFPLFNKQYASQAKMKKVMPQTKKLQERYKDDRMKLQKEMMGLYKKEGVNPAAGCLPIIPTIFVFFALYKAVFIDIDLRHAPFIGYIDDLSAPESVSILNGFGFLPNDPRPGGLLAFIALGPLAVLYGASMSLMYMLTPPTGDPMQAKIFKFMPWLFMFILASFPAGLLLYWCWNNVLSFMQQWFVTKRNNVDTPIDAFFRKITGKPDPVDAAE